MSRQIYITIPITVFVLLFALSAGLSTTFTYDPALIGDSLLAILFSVVLYLVVAYTFASTPLARALSGMLLLVGARDRQSNGLRARGQQELVEAQRGAIAQR